MYRGRTRIQGRGRDLAGRITLDAGVLKHSSPSCGEWLLPISDIRLIAEETDESGPWGEDWRIVFAASNTRLYPASISADGMWPLLDELSGMLGTPLVPSLAASTSFASRILYPSSASGFPLYRYVSQKRWHEWIWPGPVVSVLSDRARGLLGPTASNPD